MNIIKSLFIRNAALSNSAAGYNIHQGAKQVSQFNSTLKEVLLKAMEI